MLARAAAGVIGLIACAALATETPPEKATSPFVPLFETTTIFPAAPKNKPNYRIPALIRAANGDLLAFAEKRNDGPGDIGDHDIVFKRSRDGGETWEPARRAEELITPRCHGAVERFDRTPASGKNPLLFSSPASPRREQKHPYGRTNLAVRVSCDEGATWSQGKTIWPHPSSYSDIAILEDGTIGLVYERGPEGSTRYWDEIQFARFDLPWLSTGE